MNVVPRSTGNTNSGTRELTLKCKFKCYINPWITHWASALVKGNREPHEAKKKSFDLGGNRTHYLRIRSTVTLPTELQGRTEKVGDDFRWCCNLVPMRINSEVTKQTQRSKCSIFNTFSMLISRCRSSAGRPIKCQGAPSRRGVPTGSTIITDGESRRTESKGTYECCAA